MTLVEIKDIRTAIGLLNSMVQGGESHSNSSETIVNEALKILDRLSTEKERKWIKMKDQKPDDGQLIWVGSPGHGYAGQRWAEGSLYSWTYWCERIVDTPPDFPTETEEKLCCLCHEHIGVKTNQVCDSCRDTYVSKP